MHIFSLELFKVNIGCNFEYHSKPEFEPQLCFDFSYEMKVWLFNICFIYSIFFKRHYFTSKTRKHPADYNFTSCCLSCSVCEDNLIRLSNSGIKRLFEAYLKKVASIYES